MLFMVLSLCFDFIFVIRTSQVVAEVLESDLVDSITIVRTAPHHRNALDT